MERTREVRSAINRWANALAQDLYQHLRNLMLEDRDIKDAKDVVYWKPKKR